MWLIVCLLTWGLLSGPAVGCDDEILISDSETWNQCLAILASDVFSPVQTGLQSQRIECKSLRPKIVAKSATSTPQTPCVFSHPSFRNGRGLVLVTTPEVASNLLSQGALDERDQYDPYGSSSPGDFVPGPVLEPESGIPAYEVRSLPGSGKGVIALRHIKRDEIFLLDHPTILIAWNLIGLFWDKTQESFLESALIRLPKDAKRRVLGLSRTDRVPGLPLCDLFKTNVCGFVLGDGTPHIGLFTEFARINHACVPNAFYRVSPRHLRMEVVAFRDIEPGEEIYINYAHSAMPSTERHQYLESDYGFNCRCSLCTLPELERATSDRHRRELEALRVDIDMALRQRRWTDAAKHASEAVLKLSEAEILAPGILDYSLTPLYLEHYEELARIYHKVGDVSTAKSYGDKALQAMLHLRGTDSYDAHELSRFLKMIRQGMQ
ncbi:hypothetical protein FVER14953_00272 [Fusarium verticillioides]|nr:hypothetical protein FVER14953_00272 [Fusarium verticillioides]